MRKWIFGFAIITVVMTLAACNNPGAQGTAVPVVSPSPGVSPTAGTTPQGGTAITFETTGGLAGVRKKLDISPEGKATYTDRDASNTMDLTGSTYTMLLDSLAKSDFFNLQDRYDNGNVADDIYYAITVKQGNRSKTVTVAQVGGADITPHALQDLIARLNAVEGTVAK